MVDRYTQMKVMSIHGGRWRTHVDVTGLNESPSYEFWGVRGKNGLLCGKLRVINVRQVYDRRSPHERDFT